MCRSVRSCSRLPLLSVSLCATLRYRGSGEECAAGAISRCPALRDSFSHRAAVLWALAAARAQSVNCFEVIFMFWLGAKHIDFLLWLSLYCYGKTIVFSLQYSSLQPLLPEPDDALVAPLLAPVSVQMEGHARSLRSRARCHHTVFLLRRKNSEERVRTSVQLKDRDAFPFLLNFLSVRYGDGFPTPFRRDISSLAAARSP